MLKYDLIEEQYSKRKYHDVRVTVESDKFLMGDPDVRRLWGQSYYQDSELLYTYSYEKAIKILSNIKNDNDLNETSRLIGAVYKRYWEKSNYKKETYFHNACDNYIKSIGETDTQRVEDKGYGAFNILYLYIMKDSKSNKNDYESKINELLDSSIEMFEKIENKEFENLIKSIEEKKKIKNKNWEFRDYWYYTTIAQLYVIKSDFKKVEEFLLKGRKYLEEKKNRGDNPKRQIHISYSEIIKLIDATKQSDDSDAQEFIKKVFPSYIYNEIDIKDRINEINESLNRPKFGIALSGGGFRASLFHLGILARLAELNMLRHIETISAVSGGSIIAMAYYLRLKKELEENIELKQEDYINLVDNLIKDFLSSIQKNIRIKAFSNLDENIKIIISDLFNGDYTRTNYLGKLYLEEIYGIKKEIELEVNGKKVKNTEMRSLKINPKGFNSEEDEFFHPYFDNWNRPSKIPNLIINSTNITTGHNWKITASGMGETLTMIDSDIDKNRIYEECKYSEFKNEDLQVFKISDAIASSSAVPGLFEPIVLDTGINGEKIKLLDGGVYDNQGIQSLVHDNCEVIICSDASGYFEDNLELSSNKNKIFMRTTDNLMNVTRDFLYKQTQEQLKQGTIKAFEYFHLKKELLVDKVDLKNGRLNKATHTNNTTYNINEEIQNQLSQIRTDLDSFNNCESYSLMTSGYNMCENSEELEDKKWDKFKSKEVNKKFIFSDYMKLLSINSEPQRIYNISNLLKVGQKIPFKLLSLLKIKDLFRIKTIFWLVILIIFLLIISGDFWRNLSFLSASLIVVFALIKSNTRWLNLMFNIFIGILAYIPIIFYEKFLNKEYNKKGELDS